MENITIGYLTWKNNNTLINTLNTHEKNGLFNLILPQNRIIYFQETCQNDFNIAQRYNCRYIANKLNVGILNAFIELVENCNTKYFIFCENDFLLLNTFNNYSLQKCFDDVVTILDNNEYAQIKLSNIKNPGFLYCAPTNVNEWLSSRRDDFPYKIESMSWIHDPEKYYNCVSVTNLNNKWLSVDNTHQKWSNHIYGCNTSYLKNIVLPLLKHNKNNNKNLDVRYQGLEDTLNNTEDIPLKNEYIDELINKHKKRVIYSGGGNFYHNKI